MVSRLLLYVNYTSTCGCAHVFTCASLKAGGDVGSRTRVPNEMSRRGRASVEHVQLDCNESKRALVLF